MFFLCQNQEVPASPDTSVVVNECDVEDCYTPIVFSQNSIMSQGQEVIPIHRFVGVTQDPNW